MQRDVEEHRQKLLRSEQGLQTSQSKEQDLRKKMEVSRLTYSFTLEIYLGWKCPLNVCYCYSS
jgi:hypothetical protein